MNIIGACIPPGLAAGSSDFILFRFIEFDVAGRKNVDREMKKGK